MNTLIKSVDRNDFGVSEVIANDIQKAFEPAVEKMKELAPLYNEVMEMEDGPGRSKEAKRVRLLFVKTRTATAKIHKGEKSEYAGIGKYCDAWKNAQLEVGKAVEAELEAIEKAEEIRLAKIVEALTKEREAKLEPYLAQDAVMPSNLGELDEATFQLMLEGLGAAEKIKEQNEQKEKEEAQDREKDAEIAKLQKDRVYQTTKLAEFIPNYTDINFGILSEEEYMNDYVNPAIAKRTEKEAQEKADAEELQKLRVENEKLASEAKAQAKIQEAQAVVKMDELKNNQVDNDLNLTNEEFSDLLDSKDNPNDTDELKMKRFMRGFLELSLYKFEQKDMRAMHDKFAPKCINTVKALEQMFNIKL